MARPNELTSFRSTEGCADSGSVSRMNAQRHYASPTILEDLLRRYIWWKIDERRFRTVMYGSVTPNNEQSHDRLTRGEEENDSCLLQCGLPTSRTHSYDEDFPRLVQQRLTAGKELGVCQWRTSWFQEMKERGNRKRVVVGELHTIKSI